MQAELQGWDVAPGHGGYTGAQGPPRLMSKIGSEEKLGRWLSAVCPVSVAIRLAIWQPRPGNRDVSGTATIGRKDGWPPELRQRQGVQSTGRAAGAAGGGQHRRGYPGGPARGSVVHGWGERRAGRSGGVPRRRTPCRGGDRGWPVTAVLPGTVVITRPRHPLAGRELQVLGGMRRHGRVELLLVLPDGSKRLIPAEWTSQHADGGGNAGTVGLVTDLLAASVLVSAFSARDRDEREQAARKPPAKEDNRAACPAQSAAGPGSGATPGPASPAPRTAGHGGDHAAGRPDRQGGTAGGGRR